MNYNICNEPKRTEGNERNTRANDEQRRLTKCWRWEGVQGTKKLHTLRTTIEATLK